LRAQVRLEKKYAVSILVYRTDKVYFAGSPKAPSEEVQSVADRVLEICRFCTYRISDRSFSSITRAEGILAYVRRIEATSDVTKMIAVILADTMIEMIVTEMMKDKGIRDSQLLKSGMPDKLQSLRDTGLPVYQEEGIRQLRSVRNRAVHDGSIPSEGEAANAVRLAEDIFTHY